MWVTELFNDRGDDHAPWKFEHASVRSIAELVTHGTPDMRIRAGCLLEALEEEKPQKLERDWRGFSTRFASEIKVLDGKAKKRKPADPKYSPKEMRRVVVGAYAGLSRQAGNQLDARVRQTALTRLADMAKDDAELLPTVLPLVSMGLADRDVAVRKVAFEGLGGLGMPAADLAAEAISVGFRDMGVAGLRLLAESGKGKEGLAVLERVYANNTDGLETEAGKLLAESKGWTEVYTAGLTAKSANVRNEAVRGLARHYDQDEKAAKAATQGARILLRARSRWCSPGAWTKERRRCIRRVGRHAQDTPAARGNRRPAASGRRADPRRADGSDRQRPGW